MRALILCGGRGIRAHPLTIDVPKPLLPLGGVPVLRHLLDVYAGQGCTDVVLAAGFRVDLVRDFAAGLPPAWEVEVVDTGLDTGTGERVRRCRSRLGPRFFLTYGDGLADVDLAALLAFHADHDGAVTVTTVPLPSQYGTIEAAADGRVTRFREKPVLPDHRINAGFFVVESRAFALWAGQDLEREVLPGLAVAGELWARPHQGFWRSVDSVKDLAELDRLAAGPGPPPWDRASRS